MSEGTLICNNFLSPNLLVQNMVNTFHASVSWLRSLQFTFKTQNIIPYQTACKEKIQNETDHVKLNDTMRYLSLFEVRPLRDKLAHL